MNANSRQVGGNHYAQGGSVQHWDFIAQNLGPGYLVGCATKYIARWRQKDRRKDLEKALHFIEKLREGARAGEFTPPGKSQKRIPVAVFLKNNPQIGTQEGIAIQHLMYWQSEQDLVNAEVTVRGLIAQNPEG